MADVAIAVEKQFPVAAPFNKVWAYLDDTRLCLSHYPKLDELIDLGNNRWRWKLEKIGTKGFSHQIVYAVAYITDKSAGSIVWQPIEGDGNSRIGGSFTLVDNGDETQVTLKTDGLLNVPVPRLLKSVVVPFVEKEFASQIATFIGNLQRAVPAH